MSEPKETRTEKQSRFRAISLIIAVAMLVGTIATLIGPFTLNVSASITGDAYSGSGDWAVTNPTVYTNEVVNVFGNLNITSGSLTLVNTTLTMEQPSAFARTILVSGGYLSIQSGSVIQSTNYTAGKWNTNLRINNGIDFLYMDNSTSRNILFDIVHDGSHINNSTLYASGIWNQYAFGYDVGAPCPQALTLYNDTLRDTTTVGQAQHDLIMTGSNFKMNYCQFTNITMTSYAADYNSMIHGSYQNNMTITHNTFADNTYPVAFFRGDVANPIGDLNFANNTFFGVGNTNGTELVTEAIYLMDISLRATLSDNYFRIIRNGSMGIEIDGHNWILNDNRFDRIDATNVSNIEVASAIRLNHQGNNVLVHGTIINTVQGSSIAANNAIGIYTTLAGNYTVCHSVIRNITNSANGISPTDPTNDLGADIGNIRLFANYMTNIQNLSNGIYKFGAGGAEISWNNLSYINGCGIGIMMHDSKQPILVHNNSVTNPTYGGNTGYWWSISVGAYSVCAANNWNVTFRDNHATGTTFDWPDYDISAEKLGGGFWNHVEATIDVSEEAIIHTIDANVTLIHDGRVLQILQDGMSVDMTYYANGTSRTYIPQVDWVNHWINVTPTDLSLITTGDINISVNANPGAAVMAWNGTATGTTVTFTLSDLTSGATYKIYVDSVVMATMAATGGQVSFAYSAWSSHTFQVVLPTTYLPPEDATTTPSDKSPGTSDPGTTSFSWTSPGLILVVSCSILIALVLLLRRPRGRSGTRHS